MVVNINISGPTDKAAAGAGTKEEVEAVSFANDFTVRDLMRTKSYFHICSLQSIVGIQLKLNYDLTYVSSAVRPSSDIGNVYYRFIYNTFTTLSQLQRAFGRNRII